MNLPALLAKYDTRVPRYTSYPTAPHFSAAVDAARYAAWLADLPKDEPLSLYLHVPFCQQLCNYCGCNTAVVRREAPRLAYAAALRHEIAMVAQALRHRPRVTHIHWGGGTPTALPASALLGIMHDLRTHFDVAADAEIAVELDPRHLPDDRLQALAAMGVSRVSLGVQDFAPDVQVAVGRIQSFATTRNVATAVRAIGVTSLNLDLMYGLPLQTVDSVIETTRQALQLAPDRVAVFGYAHVPWMKKHQSLLPEAALPDAPARFAQREATECVLREAGYTSIGLDHFAKPTDSLAQAAATGALQRNFQGYTSDDAKILLAFGASAIGGLPQGYVQNAAHAVDYMAAIKRNELPVEKGIAFTDDDRERATVIQGIMCQGQARIPTRLRAAAARLSGMQQDGLIMWHGDTVTVTEPGRPFVRSVAAAFDAYLQPDAARHSRGV